MKTALLQLTSSDQPQENLATVLEMVDDAISKDAQFILTPEVTNCVSLDRQWQNAVLSHEGEDLLTPALMEKAQEAGVHILLGSTSLKLLDEREKRFVNRSFLIAPQGHIVARYDKIHMFDVTISDDEAYRESSGYRPGTRAVIAETAFAQIGMCICYDMRFPLLANALVTGGAEILTYPSAFSPTTGAAHWHSLLRARAIEAGAWVLAPAQTGTHFATQGKARRTYGHSLAVDPWGEVVLDAGTEPGVYIFDLEMGKVAEARRRIPSQDNARQFKGP